MGDEVKTGLVVTLKDNASSGLKSFGKSAKTSLDGVRGSAAKAADSFKMVGEMATGLNQGLELAKKGWEAFRLVVIDTIAKSLEFRDANDAAAKQINDFVKSTDTLRARLGDALIPVVQAAIDAFSSAGDGIEDWVVSNQKLIGSTLVSWISTIADILVTGIAAGSHMVVQIWNGWLMVIDSVKLGVNKFFEGLLTGASAAIEAMRWLARATGQDGLAASLSAATSAVSGLSAAFAASGDEAAAGIAETAKQLDEQESKIADIAHALHQGIGEFGVAAERRLAEAVIGTNTKLEDQLRLQQEAAEAEKVRQDSAIKFIDAVSVKRQAAIDNELAKRQMQIKLADDLATQEEERLKTQIEENTQLANTIAGPVVNAMAQAASGAGSFEDAMVGAIGQVIEAVMKQALTFIVAKAAGAAASSYSSAVEELGWPWGLVIGAGAAATAFAAVSAMKSKVKKFARGGLVTGGQPGSDSVPSLLTPGELVLPVGLTRALFSVAGKRPPQESNMFASGGMVPAASGAGGVTVNMVVQNQSLAMPSPADAQRLVMRLKRPLETAVRDRRIDLVRGR